MNKAYISILSVLGAVAIAGLVLAILAYLKHNETITTNVETDKVNAKSLEVAGVEFPTSQGRVGDSMVLTSSNEVSYTKPSSANVSYSASASSGTARLRATTVEAAIDELEAEKIGGDLLTTKGDLFVRGANGVQRLAAGTNGQVLVSNPSASVGLEWQSLNSPVFYVSATGTPSGDGSQGDPWDIDTAMTQTQTLEWSGILTLNMAAGAYSFADNVFWNPSGLVNIVGTLTIDSDFDGATVASGTQAAGPTFDVLTVTTTATGTDYTGRIIDITTGGTTSTAVIDSSTNGGAGASVDTITVINNDTNKLSYTSATTFVVYNQATVITNGFWQITGSVTFQKLKITSGQMRFDGDCTFLSCEFNPASITQNGSTRLSFGQPLDGYGCYIQGVQTSGVQPFPIVWEMSGCYLGGSSKVISLSSADFVMRNCDNVSVTFNFDVSDVAVVSARNGTAGVINATSSNVHFTDVDFFNSTNPLSIHACNFDWQNPNSGTSGGGVIDGAFTGTNSNLTMDTIRADNDLTFKDSSVTLSGFTVTDNPIQFNNCNGEMTGLSLTLALSAGDIALTIENSQLALSGSVTDSGSNASVGVEANTSNISIVGSLTISGSGSMTGFVAQRSTIALNSNVVNITTLGDAWEINDGSHVSFGTNFNSSTWSVGGIGVHLQFNSSCNFSAAIPTLTTTGSNIQVGALAGATWAATVNTASASSSDFAAANPQYCTVSYE